MVRHWNAMQLGNSVHSSAHLSTVFNARAFSNKSDVVNPLRKPVVGTAYLYNGLVVLSHGHGQVLVVVGSSVVVIGLMVVVVVMVATVVVELMVVGPHLQQSESAILS